MRQLRDLTAHPVEGWIEFRFDDADTVRIHLKDGPNKTWDPMSDMVQMLYLLVLEQKERIDRLSSKIELFEGNQQKLHYCVNEMLKANQMALDPRQWTLSMSDAWHRALPDTTKAFEDLRQAANDEVRHAEIEAMELGDPVKGTGIYSAGRKL